MSELLRLAWRLERRAPDLPVLLVSNEPSADRALSQLSIDCNKLEGSAVIKSTGCARAVGQSRCKGRVRIGTVGGKLREGGPGNRTRPPAWESNPAVLVEQLVDELDAVVGARAVVDLHAFGRDERRNRDAHVRYRPRVADRATSMSPFWRDPLDTRTLSPPPSKGGPGSPRENFRAAAKPSSSPSTDRCATEVGWDDELGLSARTGGAWARGVLFSGVRAPPGSLAVRNSAVMQPRFSVTGVFQFGALT